MDQERTHSNEKTPLAETDAGHEHAASALDGDQDQTGPHQFETSQRELAERVCQAQLGADAGVAFTGFNPLPKKLQRCADAIVEHLDAAFARIWVLDQDQNVLELHASAGLYTHLDGAHSRVAVGQYKIGVIAQERRPHLTNDVQGDPRVHDQAWAKREGMVAFAGYPLLVEDRVEGVLAMFSRRPFPQTTLAAPASVADEIALGIRQARMEEERNKLLLQAQQERELLYSLFTQVPAIIAVLRGPDHVYELANPLYLQLIGRRPVLGKPVRQALPELEGQGIYELLDGVYATGKPFIGKEVRVELDRQGNGILEDGYFNFVYQPAFDAAGNVDGVLVHAVDVTEQVQARKDVEAAEERLRFMAESMPQKIFRATASGDIDYFNPQWTEYTGLSFEQIRDWGWTQFIHPDDVEKNVRVWRHSIDTGEPFQLEHRFRSAGGSYRWHLSRALPMKDDTGQIVKWFGANTDIDDQKKAMEQRDEFIGVATHELKTPVTSVKAYAQALCNAASGAGAISRPPISSRK